MIKKILIPALALAATSVALPAAAQSFSVTVGTRAPAYAPGYGYDRHDRYDRYERDWVSINQRQRQLDRRIDQGIVPNVTGPLGTALNVIQHALDDVSQYQGRKHHGKDLVNPVFANQR